MSNELPEDVLADMQAGPSEAEIAADQRLRRALFQTVVPLTTIRVPTVALDRLRLAWEVYSDEAFRDRATELIRDLFDGQDGHLLRIDEVLGPRS